MKTSALLILLVLCPQAQSKTLRLGSTRFWHPRTVDDAAFSPDGKSIATCGRDGVKIWRVGDGKLLRHLQGGALAVTFMNDGKHLIVANRDHEFAPSLSLWDLRGKLLHRWKDAFYVSGSAPLLNVSGSTLTVVASNRIVRRWNWQSRKQLSEVYLDHVLEIQAVSTDGTAILATGQKAGVRRSDDGSLIQKWNSLSKRLPFAAFSPTNRLLAHLGGRGVIRIRDLKARRDLRAWQTNKRFVSDAQFSPDEKILATLLDPAEDGIPFFNGQPDRIVLWDVRTGRKLRQFGRQRGWMRRVIFSPDGRTLACIGDKLTLWDVATGKELLAKDEHRSVVHSVVCTSDGRRLISRSQDRSVRLWDLQTGKHLTAIETFDDRISEVHLSPDGKSICWDDAHRIRTVDLKTLQEKPPQSLCWDANALRTSPDNRWQVGTVDANWLYVWHRAPFTLEKTWLGVGDSISSLRFSHRGSHLALQGEDDVIVLDASWKVAARIRGGIVSTCCFVVRFSVLGFAWSPDGKEILTTSPLEKKAKFTDIDSGDVTGTFTNCSGIALADSFSPTGHVVALVTGDEQIELWELTTRQLRARWSEQSHKVRSLCFTPDGKKLITGGADTTILIRDLYSPQASRQKLDSLWGLLGADAEKSYQAMLQMIHRKDEAVTFLSAKLKPSPKLEVRSLADLIRRLDSDDFDVREQTAKELLRLGGAASEGLRKALRSRPTLEMRRRIHKLLKRLSHGITNVQARPLRAIEVLEQIATQKARQLLKRLAAGGASETTRQAKLAIKRMGKVER